MRAPSSIEKHELTIDSEKKSSLCRVWKVRHNARLEQISVPSLFIKHCRSRVKNAEKVRMHLKAKKKML